MAPQKEDMLQVQEQKPRVSARFQQGSCLRGNAARGCSKVSTEFQRGSSTIRAQFQPGCSRVLAQYQESFSQVTTRNFGKARATFQQCSGYPRHAFSCLCSPPQRLKPKRILLEIIRSTRELIAHYDFKLSLRAKNLRDIYSWSFSSLYIISISQEIQEAYSIIV